MLLVYCTSTTLNILACPGGMCGVMQWWYSVTRRRLLWRGFCSAHRITTWLMATSLSSRSGPYAILALTGRGLATWRFQKISSDVFEHFTPLKTGSCSQWRRSVTNLGGSRLEATSIPPSILLYFLPSRGLPRGGGQSPLTRCQTFCCSLYSQTTL